MNQINVDIQCCHPAAVLPLHGSEHAMGYDLHCVAGIDGLEDGKWSKLQQFAWLQFEQAGHVSLSPGAGFIFRTGIKQQMPSDYGCLLYDRSGLGAKHMVGKLAGVIDADYRGEIFVRLVNHSRDVVRIDNGSRIVQAVYHPRIAVTFTEVDTLGETARGEAGFGSTGN